MARKKSTKTLLAEMRKQMELIEGLADEEKVERMRLALKEETPPTPEELDHQRHLKAPVPSP